MQVHEIAWGRFVAAFLLIDLVGYLPGAIAFRKAGDSPISFRYYLLYNVTHNYVVMGAAVAAFLDILLWSAWMRWMVVRHLGIRPSIL